MNQIEPFGIKVLLIYRGINEAGAAAYVVRHLSEELRESDVQVVISQGMTDARSIITADPTIQCILLKLDDVGDLKYEAAAGILSFIRERNEFLPVFLLASRTDAADVPTDILNKVNDFIWIMEDTSDFIAGRILAAIKRYRDYILPPMFKALAEFQEINEYSWHTPGHTGGTAFLKSPAGRAFFNFFGEQIFRSDLSISVGELGSLLDHSGPIGKSEKYIARVFGSHRSYHVTNGTSTSNRVVIMASVTRNQVALCDRNCHKSVEHAMTMSGAIPTYLMPSRNQYGIIGPILPERMTVDAIQKSIQENPLITNGIDPTPQHAVITNSTYDGLCYNVNRVIELLGNTVDRLHFDEAWYGYARFNPIYDGRFAMCGNPDFFNPNYPTVFATQSTHKLLAAFSQASMIHVRNGRRPIAPERFNEAFMMHASTSPFYPIIASNDVSAAMMDGAGGKALTTDSIREAVAFRRTVARLNAEFAAKNEWFVNVWQPDTITLPGSKKKTPFYKMDEETLVTNPACWVLRPNAAWHGFGAIEDDFCMLDPIKVSVTTPGVKAKGGLEPWGIPAAVLTAYLNNKGIVVEKTTDFTVLFLFSLGITKGKWGTLLNALFEFKEDYDANLPLERALPGLMQSYPKRYKGWGLHDLSDAMFQTMAELKTTETMGAAFSFLPHPDKSPVEAFESLVRGDVEPLPLDAMTGRTVATGVVPYPPGIPLLMPGENAGDADGPALTYLKALEKFDSYFPGFTHDTHGVDVKNGRYEILCLKEKK